MPVAKGIRDLGNYGNKVLFDVVSQPEGYRIEDMTQNPRLREQHQPRRGMYLMRIQNLTRPCGATPVTRRAAMIAVLKAGDIARVA